MCVTFGRNWYVAGQFFRTYGDLTEYEQRKVLKAAVIRKLSNTKVQIVRCIFIHTQQSSKEFPSYLSK